MRFFSKAIDKPNIELFEKLIRQNDHLWMDIEKLRDILYEAKKKFPVYEYLLKEYMNIRSEKYFRQVKSKDIIEYLTETEGIGIHRFKYSKNVSGVSIDKTRILEPLKEEGYAPQFFEYYFQVIECKSLISNIGNVLARIENNETTLGNNNETLIKVPFHVGQQMNLRYNYYEEAIVNFNKRIQHCIAAPKDNILLWADLKQIDFRNGINVFLWCDKIEQIMEQHPHDVYEGAFHLVRKKEIEDLEGDLAELEPIAQAAAKAGNTLNTARIRDMKAQLKELKKQEIPKFESVEQRNMYKVDALQALFANRNTRNVNRSMFLKKLGTIFESIPKYGKILNDAQIYKRFATYVTVTSYFGHKEDVIITRGTGEEDPIFKMFNYPNQTGTSEIMIFLVTGLISEAYDNGLTEDDISLLVSRHDEGLFQMKKSVLSKVAWIFEEFRKMQVDNWFPLELDAIEVGYNYTIPDKELMEIFSQSVEENKHKINIVEKGKPQEHNVFPPLKFLAYSFKILNAPDGRDLVIGCILDIQQKQPLIAKMYVERGRYSDIDCGTALLKREIKKYQNGEYYLIAITCIQLPASIDIVDLDIDEDDLDALDSITTSIKNDRPSEEYQILSDAILKQYICEKITLEDINKSLSHYYITKLKNYGYL